MLGKSRLISIALAIALSVTVVAMGVFLTSPASAHTASHASTSTTAQVVNLMPAWATQALPYVQVSNHIATVDPTISTSLGAQVAAQVQQAVSNYNATPLVERVAGVTYSASVSTAVNPQGQLCSRSLQRYWNWWGIGYRLNSCLVNDIAFGILVGAGLAGIIAAICPPCAPVAGVLAGILAIYSGWLYWADNTCGGRGAWLNEDWAGNVWVATVC